MTRFALFGFLLGVAVSVPVSLSAAPVCVRDYGTAKGNPCETFPASYALVDVGDEETVDSPYGDDSWDGYLDAEPDLDSTEKAIGCVRMYAELYCKGSKTYAHVRTKDGKTICVVDNDQPGVVNLCQSLPKLYHYMPGVD